MSAPQPIVPGMIGSNPSNSAIISMNNQTDKLMNLRKVGGKKRQRRQRGGETGKIPLAVIQTPYTSANSGGQDLQSQQADMAKLTLQAKANAEYDHNASVKSGGRRLSKRSKTMSRSKARTKSRSKARSKAKARSKTKTRK